MERDGEGQRFEPVTDHIDCRQCVHLVEVKNSDCFIDPRLKKRLLVFVAIFIAIHNTEKKNLSSCWVFLSY